MELTEAGIDDIVGRLGVLLRNDRAGVSREGLLAAVAGWEQLGAIVDAARSWVAAEVAQECRHELGDESLSVSNGFPNAKKLLAAVTGSSLRTAASRITVGSRVRPSVSITGLSAPSDFPAVEEAFFAGRIGMDAAAAITSQLAEVAGRTGWTDALHDAEKALARAAGQTAGGLGFSADEIIRLAVRVRQNLDPDGAEPRHDEQLAKRGLKLWESSDGMSRGSLALTPEQRGVWNAAVAAHLSPKTTPRFLDDTQQAEEAVTADPRTPAQKLVDAVTGILAKAAGLDRNAPILQGAVPVLNVHVSLEDLATGRAVGWVEGVTEPIPASVIDQLVCHADILTTVFGGFGEVLHHGKRKRLFPPGTVKAAAARDGGCVWVGCDVPAWLCEAHHSEEWRSPDYEPGVTDICNVALLCPFHHANVHRSEWKLDLINGKPHLIPPAWLDPDQTPRPAGQQRVNAS
jgi:hypothetical protein